MLEKLVTMKWLETHRIPYDELILGKPVADLYIDDRSFDFNVFLKEVSK